MATRKAIPKTFETVAGFVIWDFGDNIDHGLVDVQPAPAEVDVPCVVKYKNGVYDALDGATDRMWTVTFKTFPGLTVMANALGDSSLSNTNPKSKVIVRILLPEAVRVLGYFGFFDPPDEYFQAIMLLYKRIGKKLIVFKGRGLAFPGNTITLASVKKF